MLFPSFIDAKIKRFLGRKGYVRVRGEDAAALARRQRLLASHNIDLVVDVGANEGQYARQLRALGYVGRIHSFEPMESAWRELTRHTSRDSQWTASRLALAESRGTTTLHVSGNSISSSILEMLPRHEHNAPRSKYVCDEIVNLSRLDDEFPAIRADARNIWLKLDVQGYEDRVLAGSQNTLIAINIVQIELSLVQLYSGQLTFLPFCEYFEKRNFDLIGFEAGFQEPDSGVLLQVDALFKNRSP